MNAGKQKKKKPLTHTAQWKINSAYFEFQIEKKKWKIDDDNKSALNQLPNRNLIAIINARWRYGGESERPMWRRTNNRSFGFHLRCLCFVIDLFWENQIIISWLWGSVIKFSGGDLETSNMQIDSDFDSN